MKTWTTLLLLLLLSAPALAAPPPGVEVESTTVLGLPVEVVRVDLSRYTLRTGLAQGRVGRTEDLAGIAGRGRAVVAVNGSFFQAYRDSAVKNPEQNLVSGGELVHRGGDTGCTLGVGQDGTVRIDPVRFLVEGAFEDGFGAWHAWWINREPGPSPAVTVFTPAWGDSTGLEGQQVAVSGGLVVDRATVSLRIPPDGFVVHFQGAEALRLATRFTPGRPCRFRTTVKEGGPASFWERATEAVGAGPRLVTDGRVTCDPAAEGFRDPKILTGSGARSAVGLDRDGRLLLVASEGTMRQMAEVMLALGAAQAMNLDGGASSGLWTRDGYLREPGRELSNALLVVARSHEPEPPAWSTPDSAREPGGFRWSTPQRTPLAGAKPAPGIQWVRPSLFLPLIVLLGCLIFMVPRHRAEDEDEDGLLL